MMQPLTHQQYFAEAEKRYGSNPADWKFRCPLCGHVATGADYHAHGEKGKRLAAFSCVGRLLPKPAEMFEKGKGPCNYAGGGLFKLNPIPVMFEGGKIENYFDFADDPLFRPPIPSERADAEVARVDAVVNARHKENRP